MGDADETYPFEEKVVGTDDEGENSAEDAHEAEEGD